MSEGARGSALTPGLRRDDKRRAAAPDDVLLGNETGHLDHMTKLID